MLYSNITLFAVVAHVHPKLSDIATQHTTLR